MRQIAVLEWGPVSLYYRGPKERLYLKRKFVEGGPFLPLFPSDDACDNVCAAPCCTAASIAADKEPVEHVSGPETTTSRQGDVYQCSVRYALSARRQLDAAIRNLRLAFGFGFPEAVGYVNVKARKHRCAPERVQFLQTLESWAIMKNVDAVIWIDYESLASKIKMVGLADSPEVQKQFVRDAFECACKWRRPLLPEHIRRQRLRQAKVTEMTSWKGSPQCCTLSTTEGVKEAQYEEAREMRLSYRTSSKASCYLRKANGPADEAGGMLKTTANMPAPCEARTSIRFGNTSLVHNDSREGKERLSSVSSTRKRMSRSRGESLLLRRSRTLSSLRRKQRLISLLRGSSRTSSLRGSLITRMLRDTQRRRTTLQRVLKEGSESNSTIEGCNRGDDSTAPTGTLATTTRKSTVFSGTPMKAKHAQLGKTVRKIFSCSLLMHCNSSASVGRTYQSPSRVKSRRGGYRKKKYNLCRKKLR